MILCSLNVSKLKNLSLSLLKLLLLALILLVKRCSFFLTSLILFISSYSTIFLLHLFLVHLFLLLHHYPLTLSTTTCLYLTITLPTTTPHHTTTQSIPFYYHITPLSHPHPHPQPPHHPATQSIPPSLPLFLAFLGWSAASR